MRTRSRWLRTTWTVLVILMAVLVPAQAEEGKQVDSGDKKPAVADAAEATADGTKPEPAELFERVRVIARPIEEIAGSVTYLGKEELEQQEYTDVHRALSQVPGVIFQEEDGYGLRPNIGMRGTGVERSQRITLLEDGVLIAPAPYSAPSAYYFPTLGRMEGMEVRKGSSSVRQGPFTNGGVLNLISSSIPSEMGGQLSIAAGQDATRKGRLRIGDSVGRFGWMFETFQMESDGFKELDGGGSTGFDLQDYLAKFRITSAPTASRFQALEFKLGWTDQLGHETYLGLTDDDFRRTPYRRYSASSEDRIFSDHSQIQVRHVLRFGPALDLTTTIYRNDFDRNWRKLQSVRGTNISTVVADTATFGGEIDILRGDVDSGVDELAVRNNRRDYFSQGLQTTLGLHPQGRSSAHEFELGLRYHQDEEDRFQEEDLFRMSGGEMMLTTVGAPGSQANRIQSADALALFAQDTIKLQRWTLTPGLRFESIDLERLDFGTADPDRTGASLSRRRNTVDVWIPGFGASYKLEPKTSLFVGVHRGFAPPSPGSSAETRPEESVNFEAGVRHAGSRWSGELIGFNNDYSNLLGTDTLSSGGGGTGDQFNGGDVDVRGVEASLRWNGGQAFAGSVDVPVTMTYTYTHGEFQGTFDSDFDEWGTVEAGDELPYLPTHQASLGTGLVADRWSTHLNLAYVTETRTAPGQGPTSREQTTDGRLLADLSIDYRIRRSVKLYAQLRNLTDEVYVAARRPAGVRPGLPRTLFLGATWDF